MLIFEPVELQEKLTQAVKVWVEELKFEFEQESEFLVDLCNDNFNPAEYFEKDEVINVNYLIEVILPEWDDLACITCQEFIDLLEELKTAKIENNKICKSNKRILFRIEPVNETAISFLYHAMPETDNKEEDNKKREQIIAIRKEIDSLNKKLDKLSNSDPLKNNILEKWSIATKEEEKLSQANKNYVERFCIQQFVYENTEIIYSLTRGFTLFGILIALGKDYDEYFPPILDDDLFVELRVNQKISDSLQNSIFEAYLFELSNSLDISFEISPRPSLEYNYIDDRRDDFLRINRFRSLLLGKGITPLLALYNKAVSSKDSHVQILYFTKAIEYVSQTVIKIQSNKVIKSKLLSSKALNPDADFISELEVIIDKQRIYKKDKEAIKQTIITCCESSELTKLIPSFLKEFNNISVESKQQDIEKALEALGDSLYSTRNMIAHAKANYTLTGKECPEKELSDFTQCVKLATQQVIQWYSSLPESNRLT